MSKVSTPVSTERPCTLYRFFDQDRRLLYVGMTVNPGRRMEKHRADKAWWPDVTEIRMEQHSDIDALRAAERAAITAENPVYNVRMNGGNAEAPPTEPPESPAPSMNGTLVGRWFHSYTPKPDDGLSGDWIKTDGRGNVRRWQGQVIGREGDIFLCQLYSWWDGCPTEQVLVEIDDMLLWRFYGTNEDMLCADGCPENADRHSDRPCGAPIAFVIRGGPLGPVYRCSKHIDYYSGKQEKV